MERHGHHCHHLWGKNAETSWQRRAVSEFIIHISFFWKQTNKQNQPLTPLPILCLHSLRKSRLTCHSLVLLKGSCSVIPQRLRQGAWDMTVLERRPQEAGQELGKWGRWWRTVSPGMWRWDWCRVHWGPGVCSLKNISHSYLSRMDGAMAAPASTGCRLP